MGKLLEAIGITYYMELDTLTSVNKNISNVVQLRQPSRLLLSKGIKLGYMYGVPFTALEGGMILDVDREVATTKSLEGNVEKKKAFLLSRGMKMSELEHSVFESLYTVEAVSTMKILETAALSGIAIVTINKNNVVDLLPSLQISASVKSDIENLINAGNEITTPMGSVTIGAWTGTGYIALNPVTNNGAYVIEGGAAGGGADVDIGTVADGWSGGGGGASDSKFN